MYTENDVLKLKNLKNLSDGEAISGLALIKDYQKKPTKNGGMFFDGMAEMVGTIQFKVWSGKSAFTKLDESEYGDTVVWLNGKVNLYGGVLSILIEDLNAVDLSGSSVSSSDFFESKYNGKAYYKGLRDTLLKMTNEKTVSVFDMLMEGNKERFYSEFAAKGHHDNCKSGLVAHTYKVLYIGKIIKLYPNIQKFIKSMDLLYLGAAIHDIGKIVEYTNGSIKGIGQICSHHTFGIEMLMGHKEEIVKLYDEEFFYRLCAIVEQHHGEFEERPRTVEAYVVYLIDKLESGLQFVDQTVEGLEKGSQVVIDGFKLC